MPFRARERVDAGGSIVRYQNVDFIPNAIGFGHSGGVPVGGTIGLLGPGNVGAGLRVPTSMRILAASIKVEVGDAVRTYNVSIRVNGVEQGTVSLPLSALGAANILLDVPLTTGDAVTVFVVRTSGTGASTFRQMRVEILIG